MALNLRTLVLAITGAAIFSPALAQDAAACGAAITQLEMNQCARASLATADAELNRLYRSQMSAIDTERKKRLQASQRAWLKYRDSACLYETGPRSQSGSIWPMQVALCQAAFTRERNATLRKYAACTQDGCR